MHEKSKKIIIFLQYQCNDNDICFDVKTTASIKSTYLTICTPLLLLSHHEENEEVLYVAISSWSIDYGLFGKNSVELTFLYEVIHFVLFF